MRRGFLTLVFVLGTSLAALAGPRDDVLGAYTKREFQTAFSLALPLAEQNDEIAQYIAGKLLRAGQGVEKDHQRAAFWLRKAAEKGNSAAQQELGSLLAFEMKSREEGRVWLKKAIDARYPPAFKDLGWLIETSGAGAAGLAEAAELYRQGAVLNDIDAQALYAKALLNGRGIPKDEKAAAQLYCALRSNDSRRQCARLIIQKSIPGVEPMAGMQILIQLADQGDDEADVIVAEAYLRGDIVNKDVAEGVRRLRRAAAKGSIGAAFDLGWLSTVGTGVDKDLNQAFTWYKKASDAGSATAPNRLGNLLWDGIDGKPDRAEAVRFYRLGAERGDDSARFRLASALRAGIGAEKDELAAGDLFCGIDTPAARHRCAELMLEEKTRKNDPDAAIALMRKAADQGDGAAQARLGSYYLTGQHVDKDVAEGTRLTKLAAEQGVATALHNLGYVAEKGLIRMPDFPEALRLYQKAAEGGHVPAFAAAGRLLSRKSSGVLDLTAAAVAYRKGGDLGDDDAKLSYAYAVLNGWGVPRDELAASDLFCGMSTQPARWRCALLAIDGKARGKDKQSGFTILGVLSEEGYAPAQGELGYYLFSGKSLKKNVAEGVRLTEIAAQKNDALAMNNLGYLHEMGIGYKKNLLEAVKWFEKAVEFDNSLAMVNLGKILERGALGKPDLGRALTLYRRASDNGNVEAKALVDKLSRRYISPVIDFRPPP